MMKTMLLAGTMIIAAPAVAQTAPQATAASPSAPLADQASPTTATPVEPAVQSAPQTAQATDPTQPSTATAQTADAAGTSATPAADSTQVASAVDSQFGTYDKNSDGKLSRAEFAEWMVALKTASDPSTKAESAATKKWVGAAFAQADKDRNKVLDKAEVTGFLQQGQS